MRKWINDRPKLIIAITCVSVLLLLVTTIIHLAPARIKKIKPGDKEWFYDLNAGELFIADKDLVPPIEAPSGPMPNGQPAGVKACVLSYVSEPNEADCFIGFLETVNLYTENDSSDSANISSGGAMSWGHGKLIRRVENHEWVPADSSEGRAILEEAFIPNENGERPYYIRPE